MRESSRGYANEILIFINNYTNFSYLANLGFKDTLEVEYVIYLDRHHKPQQTAYPLVTTRPPNAT